MKTSLEIISNKTQSAIGIPREEMDALLSLPYRETTLLRNLSFKNLLFAKKTLISLEGPNLKIKRRFLE